jgi:hypothetical protein
VTEGRFVGRVGEREEERRWETIVSSHIASLNRRRNGPQRTGSTVVVRFTAIPALSLSTEPCRPIIVMHISPSARLKNEKQGVSGRHTLLWSWESR